MTIRILIAAVIFSSNLDLHGQNCQPRTAKDSAVFWKVSEQVDRGFDERDKFLAMSPTAESLIKEEYKCLVYILKTKATHPKKVDSLFTTREAVNEVLFKLFLLRDEDEIAAVVRAYKNHLEWNQERQLWKIIDSLDYFSRMNRIMGVLPRKEIKEDDIHPKKLNKYRTLHINLSPEEINPVIKINGKNLCLYSDIKKYGLRIASKESFILEFFLGSENILKKKIPQEYGNTSLDCNFNKKRSLLTCK